jgi:hypothetical protein
VSGEKVLTLLFEEHIHLHLFVRALKTPVIVDIHTVEWRYMKLFTKEVLGFLGIRFIPQKGFSIPFTPGSVGDFR